MKKVFIPLLCVILVFLMLFGSPKIFEYIYVNNMTTNNLLILCKISDMFKDEKLVVEYYPELIFDEKTNIVSIDEKNEMICDFLEALLKLEDFEKQKLFLEKAYLSFSDLESATRGGTGFVISYYAETRDKDKSYELYELLLETSSKLDYKFKNAIYTKYIAFIIENGDYELLEEVRAKRIEFLKNNGVDLWVDEEQSAHLGDGTIIDD